MAAFDHIRDLNDIALKPRLLRSLLKEHLPDETLPFRDPSQLSSIVSIVKTHKLLSEEIPPSTDNKHVSAWKSAVDAWLDRILMLARTNLVIFFNLLFLSPIFLFQMLNVIGHVVSYSMCIVLFRLCICVLLSDY